MPPHLRNSQGSSSGGGTTSNDNNNSGRSSGYGGRGGGGYNGGGGSNYNNNRGSSGGGYGGRGDDRRGSYEGRDGRGGDYGTNAPPGGGGPPTQSNSRWSNNTNDGGGGGGGYRGGGGGGYGGGGSSSYRGGPSRNERGFHGSLAPDPRLEARLFDNSEKQTTGINFDNYDKIPCEVTGENPPAPIEEYTAETIGEDLFRNTQLCGYTRPTPVQKYSIPIGQQGRDLMACAQTGSGVSTIILFLRGIVSLFVLYSNDICIHSY